MPSSDPNALQNHSKKSNKIIIKCYKKEWYFRARHQGGNKIFTVFLRQQSHTVKPGLKLKVVSLSKGTPHSILSKFKIEQLNHQNLSEKLHSICLTALENGRFDIFFQIFSNTVSQDSFPAFPLKSYVAFKHQTTCSCEMSVACL